MIFDGARNEWTPDEKRVALDRLAVGGSVVAPPRREPWWKSLLGLLGIAIIVLGATAVVYGITQ